MRKTHLVLVMAFLVILLMSPQNLYPSDDPPTRGIESYSPAADGDNWLTGWGFRQQIEFTESGSAGTNYALEIVVDDNSNDANEIYTEGNAQADFDDIRFTEKDGDTPLSYWRAEYSSGDEGVFWFKMADSLSAGQVGIAYIYWGNAGASYIGNGHNVFLFFDDFETNDLTHYWDTIGSYWSTSTGRVYDGTYAAYGNAASVSEDRRLKMWLSNIGVNETDWKMQTMFNNEVQSGQSYLAYLAGTSGGAGYPLYTLNNDWAGDNGPIMYWEYNTMLDDTWWKAEMAVDYTNLLFHVWIDDVSMGTNDLENSAGVDITFSSQLQIITSNSAGYDMWLDNFFIQKWFLGGPSISWLLTDANPIETAAVELIGSTITNDDSGVLYAHLREYIFTVNTSMDSGYADIDYVQLSLYTASPEWNIKYDEDTNVFSENPASDVIELVTGSSSYTKTGIYLHVTFAVIIDWDHDDQTFTSVNSVVYDAWGSYDTNVNTVDAPKVETRLEDDSFTLNDGSGTATRGNKDTLDGISAAGSISYLSSSLYPPIDEVDVYINCNDGTAVDNWQAINYEASGGTFSIDVDSDDIVGQDTYFLYAVVEGADHASSNLITGGDPYVDYIADHMTFTATSSESWLLTGETSTITLTGTYDYDSQPIPSIVWSTADSGSVSYASAGVRNWFYVSSGDVHGITSFTNTSATCTWDTITLSAYAYSWMQYSEFAVWLFWNPSNFAWAINSSAVVDGSIVQSYMNGTLDDYGVTSAGTCGDLIIGEFDTSWYTANVTITISVGGYEIIVFQEMLEVDILHSIHLEVQYFNVDGDWVTFAFQTNWNNATFYVWDNITGTPVYVGGSAEGSYVMPYSNTVGLHNLIVLVNGSQGTVDSSAQVAGTTDTASWEYLQYRYTVNPVVFTITGLTFQQNNDTIIVSGWFLTPNTTLTWVLKESGVQTGTGVLQLTASGEFASIRWTKTVMGSETNFTLTITADGSSVIINGYSFVIDSSSFIGGSFYGEGDTYYQVVPTDESLAVIGLIIAVVMIPVAIGLGFGMKKYWPTRKRDKTDDGLYRKGV